MIPNEKVCNLLFNGMELSTSGRVRPCCLFDRYLGDDTGQFLLEKHSIKKIFYSNDYQELRRKSLAGEYISECSQCFTEEASGVKSKRQRELIREVDYNNPVIQQLDIKTGNTCNLKCPICNPQHSSKFNSENKQLGLITVDNKYKYNWNDRQHVWDSIISMADNIQHLDFMGGEPMLDKQHIRVLEYLIENNTSKNITINYVTNGTVVNNKVLDLFPNFKRVSILLSADGIGRAFEYCRFPGKWIDFEKNLNTYMNMNVKLAISYSISMYSLFDVFDALDYYTDKNIDVWLNFVYYEQDVSFFPEDIKNKFVEQYALRKREWKYTENTLDSVVDFMYRNQHNKSKWEEFLSSTRKRDNFRGVNFKRETSVPLQ